jgi:hypothetical protein
MNVKDYAKINKIMGYFDPQIVAIKIVDDKSPNQVLDNFKKDLEFFNSIGGYKSVYQVKIYGDCFVRIMLKDNGTPYVYYFSTGYGETESIISEIREICKDLGIMVIDMDSTMI